MRTHFTTPKGTELPILNLKGKEYLQVAQRLVWFREEYPLWGIETEFLGIHSTAATAKATIRDAQGRIIATSHKCETAEGFPDFIEKSETGAIGRALALIGFGTQFCADELDEGERLADSPSPPKSVPSKAVPGPGNTLPKSGTQHIQTQGESMGVSEYKAGDTRKSAPLKAVPDSPGAFIMPFGKFKGKRLDECGPFGPKGEPAELLNYAKWIIEEAKKKNKPIQGETAEVLRAINAFSDFVDQRVVG